MYVIKVGNSRFNKSIFFIMSTLLSLHITVRWDTLSLFLFSLSFSVSLSFFSAMLLIWISYEPTEEGEMEAEEVITRV